MISAFQQIFNLYRLKMINVKFIKNVVNIFKISSYRKIFILLINIVTLLIQVYSIKSFIIDSKIIRPNSSKFE